MSSTQRIVILIAAVVVLAGGFVLAQGSDDDDGDDSAQTTQTAPAETTSGTETTPDDTTTESKPAPPRVETIRIEDHQSAGEAKTLEFDSGDTVRLKFTSNVAAEIHIHGYDKYVKVPADGTARTRFKANAEGIFEIEDHDSGEVLAKLQISPS